MTSRNTPLVPALWAIVWLVMSAAAAGADTYYESRQKCGIPTVVSTQGVKPNVMIVMDYSGSMQFPAYQPDDSWGGYYSSGVADFSSNITAAYVPGTTYYGLFESDKYYQYYYFDGPTPTPFTGATLAPPNNSGFFAEAPLPAAATPFTITSSASGGSGLITFTTSTSHGYAVGDWVVLSGLDKNKSLNGTGLTVQAVSSNTFTVSGTFGGTADTMGTVQKRIFGSWEAGISGNVLNWLTTSRIDAALKALIGGRSRTGAAEGYVYLDAQGSRRTVVESTNANALAYMRPGTTSDPNSYSSGSYLDKTIYMNVTGRSRGNISNATDPANVTFSGTARPTEWWVYTNTGTSTRTVTISWAGTDSRAFIGVAKAGLTPPSPASPWTSTSSNWLTRDYGNPSVSFDAAPGATYYIAVSANRSSATGYTITHDAPLTAWAPSGYSIADRSPCMVPIASNIMVRLRIPEDERGGVIKEAFDNTRIGMMYYNSVSGNVGKIQGGCGVSDLDTLRSAFESVVPYWGTPTGEAMWEAYDYFKQANDHNNADNSHFISRGTVGVDPYYDRDIFGTAKFMPCRDSYVILVSDGEWNGYVDPIVPARNMHINDLRTAESGDTAKQSVTVFSFYAFSTDDRGKSAMKATAMYGGYTNDCDSPDDWPFPNTSYTRGRANSKGWNWPLPECDPNSAYKPCCKEWNKKYDRNDDGVDDSRGVPDNYYDASDGALLEAGLRTVFQSLMVKTGAAGSVATVAQKVSEHDIVVRAMFRASDPVVKGRYIWRGHLESYYPFDSTYDFEVQDDICKDIAVTSRHCWDAGEVLAGDGASARTIKYGKQVGSAWTLADFTESNLSDLQSKLNAPLCDDSDTPEVACRKLIRWVRGVDGTMGSGMDCYRTRADNLIWLPRTQTEPWPLGDLIYSTPLIVGVPEVAAVSENDPDVAEYQAFRNAEIIKAKTPPAGGSTIHQVYKKMVYVGGNDGMLHAVVLAVANGVDAEGDIVWVDARTDLPECFDNQGKMRATPPSDACRWRSYVGKELWAYMPSNILSQLKDIGAQSYGTTGGTCMHRFTIDLSPQVYPVYRTGLGWRMVLVGGQRGGGDIYFAIDVTDPDNPELLWEYSVLKNLKEYNGTTITTIPDYTAYYEKLKALPTTWSVPYVGRIRVPHGIAFGGTECTDSGGCKKHVMFAGGGFRVFDESVTVDGHTIDLKPLRNPHIIGIDVNTGENLLADLWPTFRKEGYQTDKFPEIKRVYDKTRKAEYYIPYAGGDILLLDEYNPAATSTSYAGSDGFVDRIYLGDLTGYFYGYKFNFDTEDTQKGVLIDVWSTRSISGCVRNAYRWDRQPITTRPQASDDPTYRDRYLRVVVAAGKYDDVPGNDDDKIDSARTSLYSLIDEKAQTDYSLINGGPRIGGGSGYKAALRFRCGDHTAAYGKYRPCYSRDISQCKLDCSACADADLPTCCGGSKANCELLCGNASTTGCEPPAKCCSYNCTGVDAVCSGCATWVVESTSLPDCGESSCCDKRDTSTCTTPPCWACVYDLALPYDSTVGDKANYPGERLVSKPLIASETLFVTSYVPAYDPCTAMGTGYLYIFDYACRPFPKDWSPLNDTAFVPDEMRTSDNTLYGLRLSLGSGPPSDPVLDSAGHYVYVQMGTAEIVRIGVDLTRPGPSSGEGGGGGGGGGGTSVSPSPNWFRIRGWKEGQ